MAMFTVVHTALYSYLILFVLPQKLVQFHPPKAELHNAPTAKLKGKVVLVLNQASRHKDLCGSEM
jgi:hypothetical protein